MRSSKTTRRPSQAKTHSQQLSTSRIKLGRQQTSPANLASSGKLSGANKSSNGAGRPATIEE